MRRMFAPHLIPLYRGAYDPASGGSSPTRTFIGISANSGTTTTFSGVNIGTAAADRLVVATMMSYDNQVASTPSSPLINGSAATTVATYATTTLGTQSMIMFSASVASGTTASFGATMAAGSGVYLAVWALYGLSSTTAFHTATTQGVGTTLSVSLNIPANGVVLAASGVVNSTLSSWSGGIVTADGSNVTQTDKGYAASAQNASSATGASIQTNYAGASARAGIVAASWN